VPPIFSLLRLLPLLSLLGPGFVPAGASTCTSAEVTSDGSESRPYCAYQSPDNCEWSDAVKHTCARGLCIAAGYDQGEFASASGNMCTNNVVDGKHFYYIWDAKKVVETSAANEAKVTASCSCLKGDILPDGPTDSPEGPTEEPGLESMPADMDDAMDLGKQGAMEDFAVGRVRDAKPRQSPVAAGTLGLVFLPTSVAGLAVMAWAWRRRHLAVGWPASELIEGALADEEQELAQPVA